MKKIRTTYTLVENQRWSCYLTENNEVKNNYSIHDFGEPCSGVIKHWGTKEAIIKELEAIIKELKKLK